MRENSKIKEEDVGRLAEILLSEGLRYKILEMKILQKIGEFDSLTKWDIPEEEQKKIKNILEKLPKLEDRWRLFGKALALAKKNF